MKTRRRDRSGIGSFAGEKFVSEALERRVMLAAVPIQPNQVVSGDIATPGQMDSYTFAAAVGNNILMSMGDANSSSGVEPQLTLYGPNGKQVSGQVSNGPELSYIVPAKGAGTYTVVAQDATGHGLGAYNLKLGLIPAIASSDTDGDGGPIQSGQTAMGSIRWPGDFDLYTFSATAGNTFELSIAGLNGVASEFSVYGPDGSFVGRASSGNRLDIPFLTHAVGQSGGGQYTVRVTASNGVGSYDLELAVAPAIQVPNPDGDGGLILSGQTKTATIIRPGDVDVYTFFASAGNAVELSMGDSGPDSAVRPAFTIYDANGNQVAHEDSLRVGEGGSGSTGTNTAVRATFVVPADGSGIYTAIAQDSQGTQTGGYTMELGVAPAVQSPDANGDGGVILSGQSKTGTISHLGDFDIYTFNANPGASFELTLSDSDTSSALRPQLLLFGPGSTNFETRGSLMNDSVFSEGGTVPASGGGTYTAIVQDSYGNATGSYNLELLVFPAIQAPDSDQQSGTLLSGQTTTGSFSRPGDIDLYTFSAIAGSSFLLSGEMASGGENRLSLGVFDPQGQSVAPDKNGFYHVPSTDGGTYTVVAQTFATDIITDFTNLTGPYNLKLIAIPATGPDADGDGGPILPGQTKSENINYLGDIDAYSLSAAPGDAFALTMSDAGLPSGVVPSMSLFAPDGSLLAYPTAQNTESTVSLQYVVPSTGAGTYTVIAKSARSTGTGPYTLSYQIAIPTPAVSFNDGSVPNDTASQQQRSEVRNIVLTFAKPVQLQPGAVTLALWNVGGSGSNNGGPFTDASASLGSPSTSDGGLTWIVPVIPNSAFGDATGSLVDGIYTVALHPQDVSGVVFIGNAFATTFHRLFGDVDGNRIVNNSDALSFAAAYMSSAGSTHYNPAFDFNADGRIDNADYLQFRKRYLKSFIY